MQKPVTIHDIAREANVSSATVSRVLSNSDYPVSAAKREAVLQTAQRMNYIPNFLGKQLKTNTNMTLAVIIPSITNPFYSSVILGIEEIARKNRYNVLLCNSLHDPNLEEEYLKTIFEKQVRGLIISSIVPNKKLLKQLVQMGLNVIGLDQEINVKNICRIEYDYMKGGHMATSYLIEKGHRNITYITSPLDRPSRKSIHQGYVNTMNEYGLKPNVVESEHGEEFSGIYEFSCGKKLARTLLKQKQLPSALFCCNDMVAVGAINEFASHGLSVPKDISVVGFDGIEIGQMISPALTTIDQPNYEMGRLACNILIEMMSGRQNPDLNIMLQPKLIERNSVTNMTNRN